MKFKKLPLPPRGIKIKKGLVEKNMTQRDLAKKLSMNEQYLADIIHGRRSGNMYIDRIYDELGLNSDEEEPYSMKGVV
ncbi:MAG TPA: transcriptional regulator [Clostridiales bacterium]|nr:transcriptional regulator [Clostridiales bacterium]